MQTKICSKCGRELSLDNFYNKKHGVSGFCKECYKARVKENMNKNREHYLLHMRAYYEKIKSKLKYKRKNIMKKNKERVYSYKTKRLKDDELFALTERVRCLIYNSVSVRKGYTKKSKTQEIVGCTFEQLKEHLENTWYNNYGTYYNGEPVHIDHIIPLSSAKNEEDVIKLCHYTNLQYLKPEDNLKKSNKLDYVLE